MQIDLGCYRFIVLFDSQSFFIWLSVTSLKLILMILSVVLICIQFQLVSEQIA